MTTAEIDQLYYDLAPNYTYDPHTGTLTSYRKPNSSGRKGKARPKVIAHHPNKTIQISYGGKKNRVTVNLSPLRLCFLLGNGWLPPRVYTVNRDRTDWRLSNLWPLPSPEGAVAKRIDTDPSLELFDSIRFAETESEDNDSGSDNDLFSDINLEEPNE